MLKADKISKIFKRKHGTVKALDNASVEIKEGEFLSIIGPSGSGKSTLLLALGGMSHPNEGTVLWNNQSIYDWDVTKRSQWRGTGVGFVFQSFNLVPYLTVWENVSVGLSLANNGSANSRSIDEILEDVDLTDRKDHLPSELSIGQQQRVALARALVKNPRIIFADEPTGNLDPDTGGQVMEIIKQQHMSGKTVIVITHDPHIARIAQRRIRLVDGKIMECNHDTML
jgi:putative ABC transport system ATP-binding protein